MKTITTTLILMAGTSLFAFKPIQDDSLKVVLKLKSVNNTLTFNQPHVNPNDLEYAWEIKINSDNNLNTGDAQGYDVGLALLNIKYGTSLSYTGTIISGTDQYTRIYSGSNISYGNPLYTYFNFADTSIVITAPASYNELLQVGAGDSFYVYTYFNSPFGAETDNISPSIICQAPVNDVTGEVTSPFLDIKSIEFKNGIAVNVPSYTEHQDTLFIYPNPCNGHFFVTAVDGELLTEIYDNTGAKVLSTSLREINTERLSPGLYHVSCKTKQKIVTTNLIIN